MLRNRLRTEEILNELLNGEPASSKEVKEAAEIAMLKMLEHNPHLDPDTLARAIFFFVTEGQERISTEKVSRIRRNGGTENTSWPRLLPIIDSVVSK